MKLSTKTLEKLDTTLELVLVNDFLIDFKAAIGSVDFGRPLIGFLMDRLDAAWTAYHN